MLNTWVSLPRDSHRSNPFRWENIFLCFPRNFPSLFMTKQELYPFPSLSSYSAAERNISALFLPAKTYTGTAAFPKGRKLPIVVIEEISLKRRFRRNDPVCPEGNCLSRRRKDTSSVSCFRSFRHIQMKKCDLHFSPFYTCINFIQIYFNTILYQKYIFRQNFIIFSDSYSIWSALFIPPC